MRDPAVERVATAMAQRIDLSRHSRFCPVRDCGYGLDHCTCTVMQNARADAETALRVLGDRLLPADRGEQWGIGWEDQAWRDNPDTVSICTSHKHAEELLADAIADDCPGALVFRAVGPWQEVPSADR